MRDDLAFCPLIPDNMNRILFLLILGVAPMTLSMASTYLSYEPGAGVDKFEYQVVYHEASSVAAPTTALAFHYRINANEEVALRTVKVGDFDKSAYQLAESLVPSAQVGEIADRAWIDAVEATDFNIYIVEAREAHYEVYRVTSVAFYAYSRYAFKVAALDYEFEYPYFETRNPSEALSQNDVTGAMVLYAGKSATDCYEQLGMLAVPGHACSTAIQLELLKGIGLRTERRGDYTLELTAINGEPLLAYLTGAMCQKSRFEQPFTYQQLTTMGHAARGVSPLEGAFADVEVVSLPSNARPAPQDARALFDRNQVQIKSGSVARGLSANAAPTPVPALASDTAKFVVVYPYAGAPTQTLARGSDVQQKGLTFKTNGGATASEWTVKQGETLYFISKRLNVTVEDLKAWNDLPNNDIHVGQVLRTSSAQ